MAEKMRDDIGKIKMTPLLEAIVSNSIVDLKRLLLTKVSVQDKVGSYQLNPLHLSLSYNHMGIAKILIKEGCPLEPKSKGAKYALICAISHGHLQAVRFLLSNGVCPNFHHNQTTPLHIATVEHGVRYFKVLEILLSSGAKVDIKNASGQNPIEALISLNEDPIFFRLEFVRSYEKKYNLLLKYSDGDNEYPSFKKVAQHWKKTSKKDNFPQSKKKNLSQVDKTGSSCFSARTISLTRELSSFIHAIFKEYNLAMEIKSLSKNHFSFSIKETHSRSISFDYDLFCLEIVVRYRRYFYDLIPIVSIPFCRKEKNKFVAYYLGEKGDTVVGIYETKMELIKSNIENPLRNWLNVYCKSLIHISLHRNGGISWAKLIDISSNKKSHKKVFQDDDKYFICTIPLWDSKKLESFTT